MDAERFEASVYVFMDQVSNWLNQLVQKPTSLEAALDIPEIKQISERLPPMLSLNFETELDFFLDQIIREADERYD